MDQFLKIFLVIILLSGFGNFAIAQEYTYVLEVTSLKEDEQSFDLEINSMIGASSELVKTILPNQTTPFKKMLQSGEHEVIVTHTDEPGRVQSKVTGVVDSKTRGSAFADYKITKLKAGPGGRYEACKG